MQDASISRWMERCYCLVQINTYLNSMTNSQIILVSFITFQSSELFSVDLSRQSLKVLTAKHSPHRDRSPKSIEQLPLNTNPQYYTWSDSLLPQGNTLWGLIHYWFLAQWAERRKDECRIGLTPIMKLREIYKKATEKVHCLCHVQVKPIISRIEEWKLCVCVGRKSCRHSAIPAFTVKITVKLW